MIAAKSEGQEVGAYTGILAEENPAKVVGTIISETDRRCYPYCGTFE